MDKIKVLLVEDEETLAINEMTAYYDALPEDACYMRASLSGGVDGKAAR